MHLLDLVHWLAGPLPLHSALLRTQFWDAPVEDNAALILGVADDRSAPWAMLHVTWTEWKNMFSLEIYCRHGQAPGRRARALVRAADAAHLPHETRARAAGARGDPLPGRRRVVGGGVGALRGGDSPARLPLLGSLADAQYAWARVEDAYAAGPYAAMRQEIAR